MQETIFSSNFYNTCLLESKLRFQKCLCLLGGCFIIRFLHKIIYQVEVQFSLMLFNARVVVVWRKALIIFFFFVSSLQKCFVFVEQWLGMQSVSPLHLTDHLRKKHCTINCLNLSPTMMQKPPNGLMILTRPGGKQLIDFTISLDFVSNYQFS